MTALFLSLLGLHVAHALVAALRRRFGAERSLAGRYFGVATQTLVFMLGFYLAWRMGAFSRDLLNPLYIAAGLLAGHLIFGLSLLIIYRSVEDATSYFFDFGALWRFIVEHPYVLSRFILVGVTEEIVWRAVAQPAVIEWAAPLGGLTGLGEIAAPLAGVIAVAIAFAVVHDHFFTNSKLISTEFMLFSLALGGLYYGTGSLILVIIVHTMRDVEICHLEYIVKVHEYGDESKAAQEIERMYMRPAGKRERKRRESSETLAT